MRSVAAFLVGGIVVLLVGACGSVPTGPDQGTRLPPPSNSLPVIDSITVQGTRAKEPADFADLGESVAVTARVHDDETPVDQLQFQWSATAGTVTGSGAQVTWRAPDTAVTPGTVTLTLKLIEKFGYPGGPLSYEQASTRTAEATLHDSAREVGGMARQFLLEFSDSSIRDVAFIMRNFIPGCYGTQDETNQVADNRRDYRITNYTVGQASVSVNFGGVCPYGGKRGDACAAVPVFWDSLFTRDNSRAPAVAGTDWVAAFYAPAERKWGLCDSSFDGHLASSMRTFIR